MESAKKLNQKQLKFCNEYLKGASATQAAITAGYSKKTAYSIGNENLKKPEIAAYISKHQQKQAAKTEITLDRLQQEYTRIALFDIRKLYRPDGSLVPIHELDDDTAAAICGLEVFEELYRGKTRGNTKKVKLCSKNQALDSLAKIMGAFEADNKQKTPVVNMPVDVSHLTLEQLKELKYGKRDA